MLRTICIAAICIIFLQHIMGDDRKTCRAAWSDVNRKQVGWTNDCIKKLGYKTARDKVEKSSCTKKCILENFDVLNSDGALDRQQYDKFLKEQWPEHLHDRVNSTFQPCLKIKITEAADEYCKEYEPLVKCLNRQFANLCKGT